MPRIRMGVLCNLILQQTSFQFCDMSWPPCSPDLTALIFTVGIPARKNHQHSVKKNAVLTITVFHCNRNVFQVKSF